MHATALMHGLHEMKLALNFSRAVKSVQEELEAVDWYNQRAQATKDEQLRRILEHNRDEEIEHAMMGLEYLRRINAVFDKHMRTYLFTDGDIVEIEEKERNNSLRISEWIAD